MIIDHIVTHIDEMEEEELSKYHKEKVYLESSDLSEKNSESDN